jgi:hypothetical protein
MLKIMATVATALTFTCRFAVELRVGNLLVRSFVSGFLLSFAHAAT